VIGDEKDGKEYCLDGFGHKGHYREKFQYNPIEPKIELAKVKNMSSCFEISLKVLNHLCFSL